MRTLVFGRSGQLAVELRRSRWPAGMSAIAVGRDDVDITDAASVRAVVDRIEPAIIINAAAYTAVDRAESEPDLADAINHRGAGHIAAAAAACGLPLIHVSTDYVFSGIGDQPWLESDVPMPLSVYGRTKLAGERAVEESGALAVLLRTSWLFAAHGQNFVRTMLRLGNERETLGIVQDQVGCPTSVVDLARAIASISASLLGGSTHAGLYHYCGAGPTSWFDFAQAIFEHAGALVPRSPILTPIRTADYKTAAVRPAYSVLDCGKVARDFGVVTVPWIAGLRESLAELRALSRISLMPTAVGATAVMPT